MLARVMVRNIISFHSSQKQRRAAQRKERRKRKRQALAQARECGIKKPVVLLMLNVRKCCNLCHYHNIYSVTGSNNGETYTLEDEEINDEGDNTAGLER